MWQNTFKCNAFLTKSKYKDRKIRWTTIINNLKKLKLRTLTTQTIPDQQSSYEASITATMTTKPNIMLPWLRVVAPLSPKKAGTHNK